ncbi:Crp/Fnr family transcriptional regulator [Nonomuraea sp. NPDC050536]|uniref:Crp/Fnr family transcriptional regulator n=1 Tax=Nonomuraea sp. NPDC050536 TaxID=3364366 RepID=UPI0037C52644
MPIRLTGLGGLMPPSTWQVLRSLGPLGHREAGRVLMRQGDPADHVLALVHGRVKVSQVEPDGIDLTVAVRHPGEVLGDIAVLRGGGRTATVTAVDPCQVHLIPGPAFERFVAKNSLSMLIIRHTLDRLHEAERYRPELTALPLSRRLCHALLRVAEPDGAGGAVVDAGISQEEFGRMIRASRNAVGQVLGRLRRLGAIDTTRNRVTIKDLALLHAYATDDLPTP